MSARRRRRSNESDDALDRACPAGDGRRHSGALAVAHGQATAATDQHEVVRSRAKYKGWTQPKLTDDDILEIDGRREALIGKLQTRYAISYEDAPRQAGDFEATRR